MIDQKENKSTSETLKWHDEKSPKNLLFEYCRRHRWMRPVYYHLREGPDHQGFHIVVAEIIIDGVLFASHAVKARNKKEAERMASLRLLMEISTAVIRAEMTFVPRKKRKFRRRCRSL